jgi:hypothetical protein
MSSPDLKPFDAVASTHEGLNTSVYEVVLSMFEITVVLGLLTTLTW